MKRNREYLSQLGLESNDNEQGSRKKIKPTRKRENTVIVERRSSITRRTKLQPIQYVGPKSIREMIQRAMQQGDENDTTSSRRNQKLKVPNDNNTDATLPTTSTQTATITTDGVATSTTVVSSTSKSKVTSHVNDDRDGAMDNDDDKNNKDGFGIPYKKGNRMEIFIFKEFRRLRSVKRQLLQKIERTHRMVQKEMKYWYHQKFQFDRKMQRKLFIDQYLLQQQQQQQMKNTHRDTLRSIDQKMPFVLQAIKKYDQSILVCWCVSSLLIDPILLYSTTTDTGLNISFSFWFSFFIFSFSCFD
jgi:hypothetical protein